MPEHPANPTGPAELRALSELEFRERLSAHRLWLVDRAAGSLSAGAAQLSLVGARLPRLVVEDESLAGSALIGCQFSESTFERCDFTGALLVRSELSGSSFVGCVLRKVELNDAVARVTRFTGSDLSRADLSRADLRGADLTGCDLGWAWLVDTDLREAILEGVRLEGAKIVQAKLYNSRRFRLGPVGGVVVNEVDTSPDGRGGSIRSGVEALDAIRAV